MIKFENTEVFGWKAAIRGMRNPLESWSKSDSRWYSIGAPGTNPAAINDKYLTEKYCLGDNDINLMKRLVKAGTDHRKFMRMITVYVDITAPLYWWKEFDTYKVGTVANSCSTMHKITEKEFTLSDFSYEHLNRRTIETLESIIDDLNRYRKLYMYGGRDYISDSDDEDYEPKNKDIWWQMIQLLPSSYNQKRTIEMNYEVLANIYKSRKNHKLDEWSKDFMEWIESLPYAKELILGEE
jgi:hypothetical protein